MTETITTELTQTASFAPCFLAVVVALLVPQIVSVARSWWQTGRPWNRIAREARQREQALNRWRKS